jgi:hypothetical protein
LTRAIACIRPWPFIGLSIYIVCIDGASNPVTPPDIIDPDTGEIITP